MGFLSLLFLIQSLEELRLSFFLEDRLVVQGGVQGVFKVEFALQFLDFGLEKGLFRAHLIEVAAQLLYFLALELKLFQQFVQLLFLFLLLLLQLLLLFLLPQQLLDAFFLLEQLALQGQTFFLEMVVLLQFLILRLQL